MQSEFGKRPPRRVAFDWATRRKPLAGRTLWMLEPTLVLTGEWADTKEKAASSVAFIIDIAGAKRRKARSRLPTRCCSLRSGAGVRSTRLPARSTMGKRGRWRSGRQSLFFTTAFSPSAAVGLGSYTYRQHGKRSAPLLNLRQDQTRFWLHTRTAGVFLSQTNLRVFPFRSTFNASSLRGNACSAFITAGLDGCW